MCCRRRQGRRSAPVLVVLGKMAYDRYQSHKANKQAIAQGSSPDLKYSRIETHSLPEKANNEILEKVEMDSPPSYHDAVVVNRAVMPDEPAAFVDAKRGWTRLEGEEKLYRDDASDAESFYEVSDGMVVGGAQTEPAMGSQKELTEPEQGMTRLSRCEQKKAARAARKTERKARGGCCC